MASWRVKGYVSDSEDEDGDIEISNTNSPSGKQATPINSRVINADLAIPNLENAEIAGRSLAQPEIFDIGERVWSGATPTTDGTSAVPSTLSELQQGWQQEPQSGGGIPSPSIFPKAVDQPQDDVDSPLSTPPDSPQSLPSIGKILAGEGDFPMVEQPESSHAPQRTFRQRTANQLQPYTIDRAKHLQEWTALGMKPVPAPKSRSPAPGATTGAADDSQFDESQSQSQVDGSNSLDLMDLDNSLASSQSRRDGIYNINTDDELPGLANLLTRRSPRSMKQSRRSLVVFDIPSSDSEHPSNQMRRKSPIQDNQQDSLPSPPPSLDDQLPKSLAPDDDNEQANVSRVVPSSTPRPRKRLIIEDDTQSADEAHMSTPIPVVPIDGETSSDESLSGPEMTQVMQKRIKGVLPASWWTVEMAQKSLAAKKKQISRQYISRTPHAGVAQRKVSDHSRSRPARDYDLEELLSSETSESQSPNKPVAAQRASHVLTTIQVSPRDLAGDDMDIIEEDEVDHMLAPQHRNTSTKPRLLARGAVHDGNLRNRGGSRRQEIPLGEVTRSRKPKRVKSKSIQDTIHVLDAPDLRSPKRNTPSFLKIAARQARSKRKFTGTIASNKFFRLDSDEDLFVRELDPKSISRQPEHASSATKSHRSHEPRNRSPRTSVLGLSKTNRVLQQAIPRTNARTQDLDPEQHETAEKIDRHATLGQLVQCGPTDDAALRLTRLQSLLPLTNRSGYGKLATNRLQPREAQLEVLHYTSNLSVRPRVRSIVTTHDDRPSRQIASRVSDSREQQPQPEGQALVRRKPRKLIPVQRNKPRQTSIIGPSPDMKGLANLIGKADVSVRDKLEKEFDTYQASWFQASRQGIVYSNRDTQQHFYTFLEVLKSYVPLALQEADDERESRELRSFIHRLIPNRGQIGASGQVGNKTRSVHKYDIVVAQNVFELHKCLLSLAPGAAPRPRVLEMKVNFADAHEEICLIALSTWKDICQMHITDTEVVNGMAGWLYSMLLQLTNRWLAADTDAQQEIANLTHLVDERVLRRVVEHNQARVGALFRKVLTKFTESIQEAVNETEARSLFRTDAFVHIVNRVAGLEKCESGVTEDLFEVARTYAKQLSLSTQQTDVTMLLNALQNSFRILASRQRLPFDTIYSLLSSFLAVAREAVSQGAISWDRFVTRASPWSWDQEDWEKNRLAIKTLFYHMLIETDTVQYVLEFRAVIISFWVLTMLRAEEDDRGLKLLTGSLFKHEKESLLMPQLAAKFGHLEEGRGVSLDDSSVAELRHATVLHVIQVLNQQENNAEANDVPSGFDEMDADTLVESLFMQMKGCWQDLRGDPDQQDVYTLLIHAALRQFESHPRTRVAIDPWFYNAATFPQPVKNDLFHILNGHGEPSEDMVERAMILFDLEVEQAGRFDRFEVLETRIRDTLLPKFGDSSPQRSISMLREHARFFSQVLRDCSKGSPVYSKRAMQMLVRVLIYFLTNLHCHPEAENLPSLTDVAENLLSILPVLQMLLLDATTCWTADIFELTQHIYSLAIACLHDIPSGSISHLEAICDIASEDDSPQSLFLLELVMAGQTITH